MTAKVAGVEAKSGWKEDLKTLHTIAFSLGGIALTTLLLYLYVTTSLDPLLNGPSLMRWLESPLSELKVWHLIAIVYFVPLLARGRP